MSNAELTEGGSTERGREVAEQILALDRTRGTPLGRGELAAPLGSPRKGVCNAPWRGVGAEPEQIVLRDFVRLLRRLAPRTDIVVDRRQPGKGSHGGDHY